MKLGQNVCLDEISRTSLRMDRVGSKTKSLGHILEKPGCTLEKPHFQSDYHETGQNVCLDEILDKFENRSSWVKN